MVKNNKNLIIGIIVVIVAFFLFTGNNGIISSQSAYADGDNLIVPISINWASSHVGNSYIIEASLVQSSTQSTAQLIDSDYCAVLRGDSPSPYFKNDAVTITSAGSQTYAFEFDGADIDDGSYSIRVVTISYPNGQLCDQSNANILSTTTLETVSFPLDGSSSGGNFFTDAIDRVKGFLSDLFNFGNSDSGDIDIERECPTVTSLKQEGLSLGDVALYSCAKDSIVKSNPLVPNSKASGNGNVCMSTNALKSYGVDINLGILNTLSNIFVGADITDFTGTGICVQELTLSEKITLFIESNIYLVVLAIVIIFGFIYLFGGRR